MCKDTSRIEERSGRVRPWACREALQQGRQGLGSAIAKRVLQQALRVPYLPFLVMAFLPLLLQARAEQGQRDLQQLNQPWNGRWSLRRHTTIAPVSLCSKQV